MILYKGETIYELHEIYYRWILDIYVKSAELLKILERPGVSKFEKFGSTCDNISTTGTTICGSQSSALCRHSPGNEVFRDCQ